MFTYTFLEVCGELSDTLALLARDVILDDAAVLRSVGGFSKGFDISDLFPTYLRRDLALPHLDF
jgi:hypothetical protein